MEDYRGRWFSHDSKRSSVRKSQGGLCHQDSRKNLILFCSKPRAKKATKDGFVFKPMNMQQIFKVAKRWQQQERGSLTADRLYTRCPPVIRLNGFPSLSARIPDPPVSPAVVFIICIVYRSILSYSN